MKKMIIWMGALILGAILGCLGIDALNSLFDFIAAVYTRLFQFVAVPTIALAVMTTLATLGAQKNAGRIFAHTISYTLLTTIAAAAVGLVLFVLIAPECLPDELVRQSAQAAEAQSAESLSYYDHILSVIPNNIINPFSSGNVLSILIVAASAGLALAFMPKTEGQQTVVKFITGLQELLFTLINALIWALPVGIVAFAAQLSAQLTAGVIVGSLGKYVAVIIGGNCLQFFIVLPLFLLLRGINPLRIFRAQLPAVMMALFTKSSAATLPVTMRCAEENMKARPEVARFVLPICTTINMNGCAAFILVTTLFVMQHSAPLDMPQMLMWLLVAVISAIGNAGVPMGCYFLTLSLVAGSGGPVGILGIILPIYTIIDMIETTENVWSDSCVCAMTNKDIAKAE